MSLPNVAPRHFILTDSHVRRPHPLFWSDSRWLDNRREGWCHGRHIDVCQWRRSELSYGSRALFVHLTNVFIRNPISLIRRNIQQCINYCAKDSHAHISTAISCLVCIYTTEWIWKTWREQSFPGASLQQDHSKTESDALHPAVRYTHLLRSSLSPTFVVILAPIPVFASYFHKLALSRFVFHHCHGL